MNLRTISFLLALLFLTVPASAQLLDKAGIIAAYGGKKVLWKAPGKNSMSGFVVFDAGMTLSSGEWNAGANHGSFTGKVSIEDNKYC